VPWDDDDSDEPGLPRAPLPPDDRLWRHPSELGPHARGAATPALEPGPARRRSATWSVALAAGLAGAALSAAVIVVTGSLPERVVERSVVEKVAMTPVVSSPMVRGERGVVAVAEHLAPAVVRLDVERDAGTSAGSGVLFRDDGLVLTSAQVVSGAITITAVLADGRRLAGELVGLDRLTDVAVVRVAGRRLPVAVLGSAADLEVGAPTVALGSPAGPAGGPVIATGVVSGIHRQADLEGGATLHGLIETDAPVAAGGAGGPLVDAGGAVIGISTVVLDGAERGSGYAIPVDLVRRVAGQLVASGRAAHSWLGVDGTDLTNDLAGAMGVGTGAAVRAVAAGSPAAVAGLAPGDVITDLDGADVGSMSELVVRLRDHAPGSEVRVGYWRAGRHHETTVVLGERP